MGIKVVKLLCEIKARAVIDRIHAEKLPVAVEPVDQGIPVKVQIQIGRASCRERVCQYV